jgi:hypothetical protein
MDVVQAFAPASGRSASAPANIAQQRLRTQRLAGPGFDNPADVVRWFGAVQAQDYPGALWAVGMRTTGATEASVEQALIDRAIVRTWPLRGTLHFVAPEDVRWMLAHFAPRTVARAASRFRQLELDARVLAKGASVVVKGAGGRPSVTRRAAGVCSGAGSRRGTTADSFCGSAPADGTDLRGRGKGSRHSCCSRMVRGVDV